MEHMGLARRVESPFGIQLKEIKSVRNNVTFSVGGPKHTVH